MTADDPPQSEHSAHEHAVVIDTALGVFGASRLIKTGTARKFFLIKADRADTQSFEIGLENKAPQKLTVLRENVRNLELHRAS